MPTATFYPVKDAEIKEVSGVGTSKQGTDSDIRVGMEGLGTFMRGLLYFDITSIASEYLSAAELQLEVFDRYDNDPEGDDATVARVTVDNWVEDEVTWDRRSDAQSWTPGGSVSGEPTPVAFSLPSATGTKTIAGLLAFCTYAIDTAGDNKVNLRLRKDLDGAPVFWMDFRSREYAGTDDDPKLVVDYIILPAVTTDAIHTITRTTAKATCTVTSDGDGTISSRGACYNTTGTPTTSDPKTNGGTTVSTYNHLLGNVDGGADPLLPATTYFVRAYVINEAGVAYGEELSFTTLARIRSGRPPLRRSHYLSRHEQRPGGWRPALFGSTDV